MELRGKKKLGVVLVFSIILIVVGSILFGPWRAGLFYYFTSPWVELKDSDISLLEPYQLFTAQTDKPNGIVLLVHGLNLKPTRMDDLARFLSSKNFDVYRIALTGHRGIPGELLTSSREKWLSDIKSVYDEAFEIAVQKNIPLYFVGYSLGGLLGVDLEAYYRDVRFAKVVFFAPALAVKVPIWLINFAYSIIPNFEIASSIPAPYRANNRFTLKINYELGRSLEFVNAHLEQSGLLNLQGLENKINKPTLVFIDPNDELVSVSGIQDIIRKYKLNMWNIEMITADGSTNPNKIHHAIVDEPALGSQEWSRVTSKIENFLKQ